MLKFSKTHLFFTLGITILIFACEASVAQAELIKSKDFEGVILVNTGADGWTPNRTQIIEAEENLKKHFASGFKPRLPIDFEGQSYPDLIAFKERFQGKTHTRAQAWLRQLEVEEKRYQEVAKKWPNYKRQYVGVHESGKKLLMIRFLTGELENWKTKEIQVKDGGTDFLEVAFDLKAKIPARIYIHGEA